MKEKRINGLKRMIVSVVALSLGFVMSTGMVANAASKISTSKAKKIALRHAGVKASKAKFTKVVIERDDGIWKYEVDFYAGNYEYDYEIHANTGRVIDVDKEYEPRTSKKSNNKFITAKKAKKKALKHAGVKASKAKFVRVKKERDDGIWKYEVEFYAGKYEYDYEVNAKSGRIISAERERMDYDD